MIHRRAIAPLILAIVAIVAVLTGCTATDNGGTLPSPSAPSSSPSPAVETEPSEADTPSPTDGPAAGAVEPCAVTALVMTYDPHPQDSGMGHSYFTLDFTNTAAEACILDGYPELWAIDDTGNELGDRSSQQTVDENQPVTLAASGGVAAVDVVFTNPRMFDCTIEASDGLRVYMPAINGNAYRDGIFTSAQLDVCAEDVSLFSVGPFTQP